MDLDKNENWRQCRIQTNVKSQIIDLFHQKWDEFQSGWEARKGQKTYEDRDYKLKRAQKNWFPRGTEDSNEADAEMIAFYFK